MSQSRLTILPNESFISYHIDTDIIEKRTLKRKKRSQNTVYYLDKSYQDKQIAGEIKKNMKMKKYGAKFDGMKLIKAQSICLDVI
jgi:hypothetical protein